MKSLGFVDSTKIHCVGNGALWIFEQGEKIAGSKKEMLTLKLNMEEGKIQEVMDKLKKEQEIAPNHEGLEACTRYIKNRSGQFDYAGGKAKELPLGSGKVESTHLIF